MKQFIFFLLTAAILLTACKKENDLPTPLPEKGKTNCKIEIRDSSNNHLEVVYEFEENLKLLKTIYYYGDSVSRTYLYTYEQTRVIQQLFDSRNNLIEKPDTIELNQQGYLSQQITQRLDSSFGSLKIQYDTTRYFYNEAGQLINYSRNRITKRPTGAIYKSMKYSEKYEYVLGNLSVYNSSTYEFNESGAEVDYQGLHYSYTYDETSPTTYQAFGPNFSIFGKPKSDKMPAKTEVIYKTSNQDFPSTAINIAKTDSIGNIIKWRQIIDNANGHFDKTTLYSYPCF
jgi:hypothetical protein